jgi:hypothetical protein
VKRLNPVQQGFGVFTAICLAALVDLVTLADGSGVYLGHFRRLYLLEMLPMAGLVFAGGFLTWRARSSALCSRVAGAFSWLQARARGLGAASWALLAAALAAYPFYALSPAWGKLLHLVPGLAVFALIAFLGAFCLSAARQELSFPAAFVLTAAFQLAVLILAYHAVTISNYPFSMGWSESSQIYWPATYLSPRFFGFWTPLPVIQPGYEILMSLPYLASPLPIWVPRAWLVLLWTGFSLGTSQALARVLRIGTPILRWGLIAFGVAYFLNIPVYFHLLASAFLVFFGFASRKPGARWAGLIAASIWAGVTRVNWFPMPGALAATLYLLETAYAGRGWRYFLPPALMVAAGTAVGGGVYYAYMLGSRNPLYYFGSTFTSSLLWYRLFPSPTSGLGVVIQTLLYALPVGLFVLYELLRRRAWHPLRLAALALGLAVFFFGGMIVSAKIGGGNNIHNLDAFLTLLLVIGAFTFFQRFTPDYAKPQRWTPIPALAVLVAILIPIAFTLPGVPLQLPHPPSEPERALAEIQKYVDQANASGGEVLFMTERQLLPTGAVHGVCLVPEYEKWFQMEMSMAGNATYFQGFHQDLQTHRFAAIIAEPLTLAQQGRSQAFGEENDVWVHWVSTAVLENYQPAVSLPEYNFAIYIPK